MSPEKFKARTSSRRGTVVVEKAVAQTKDVKIMKNGSKIKKDPVVVEMVEAEELPPGWKIDVKIRKNGSRNKKDLYYKDPITGYIFRSMKDVQRYLKTGDVGRLAIKPKDDMETENENVVMEKAEAEELPPNRTKDVKTRKNDSKIKKDPVVGAMVEAEELPPGWMKNVKLRKIGSKIKTDRYYKDPVTGYIFYSMKDVQRYLETGDVGRLATKPKDDLETQDENAWAEGDDRKLPETGTDDGQVMRQQSSSLTKTKNDQIIGQSTDIVSNDGSEEREVRETAGLRGVDLSEVNKREKIGEAEEQANLCAPLNGNSSHKRSLENGLEGNKKRTKSCDTSPSTLPRRASKRLAGIDTNSSPLPLPLPPPSEPKTRRQLQAAATNRVKEAKTSTLSTTKRSREPKTHAPSGLATRKGRDEARKVQEATSCQTQANPIASPEVKNKQESTDNKNNVEESCDNKCNVEESCDNKRNVEERCNNKRNVEERCDDKRNVEESCENVKKEDLLAYKKQEPPPVLPPTAAPPFALEEHRHELQIDNLAKERQSLPPVLPLPSLPTVEPDNNPREKQVETNNDAPDHQKPTDAATADIKPDSPVNFSLTDLWTDPCIEFAVKTLTGDLPIPAATQTKPATPPPEFSLDGIWTTDPCIEFAVKTLTGAIPVRDDICVQDYLHHQAGMGTSSSETRGESSFSLPDVEVLSRHYETKTAPGRHGNGSLGKPGNKVDSKDQKFSRTRWF